jgi:uncharacterized protein (DUF885 family)
MGPVRHAAEGHGPPKLQMWRATRLVVDTGIHPRLGQGRGRLPT